MSATNPFRFERAQDLDEERFEQGPFRCDRCQLLKPLPFTWQDGRKVCRRCWDTISPNEAAESMAQEIAMNSVDPIEPLAFPVTGSFSSQASVTSFTPRTVNLTRGGASKQIVLTGVGFSSVDTTSASSASITVSKVVDSTTQITLTISAAGGMTPGDYNLLYNGDTLQPRGILKVR